MVTAEELWNIVRELNVTHFDQSIRITGISWIHEKDGRALAYYSGDCLEGEILLVHEKLCFFSRNELRPIIYHEMAHQIVPDHGDDFQVLVGNLDRAGRGSGYDEYAMRVDELLNEQAVKRIYNDNTVLNMLIKISGWIGAGVFYVLFPLGLALTMWLFQCLISSKPFNYDTCLNAFVIFVIGLLFLSSFYIFEDRILPQLVRHHVARNKKRGS